MFFSIDGQYAIQAIEPGKLTFKQIESCRRTLRRTLGKSAQI
jgi:ribosomal protein L16/L10AE